MRETNRRSGRDEKKTRQKMKLVKDVMMEELWRARKVTTEDGGKIRRECTSRGRI